MPNLLFYGDNLFILRDHIEDASVDLIYLDPPFNAARDFNVLFKDDSGKFSDAQIKAFTDTWHWSEDTELAYEELVLRGDSLGRQIEGFRLTLNRGAMMAYLVMMAARLVELHRVLKPTGSLYLHCDPTAGHYLKIILDSIFGPERFLNEIIWKRTSAHSSAKRCGSVHDILFCYGKSEDITWNQLHHAYDEEYVKRRFRRSDSDGRRWKDADLTGAGVVQDGETGQPWRSIDVTAKGRHWMYSPAQLDKLDSEGKIYWPSGGGMPRLKQYLDEMPGIMLQDVWTDIPPINSQAKERMGYPTQKPLALLERIIEASSNPGDVVLDPFCGCGTAVVAAQKLGRHWVGIDITHLAIALIRHRLNDSFGEIDYKVLGEPTDLAGARALAAQNAHQFEWWALSLVKARPARPVETGSRRGKKGADRGFDGQITFMDDQSRRVKRVLVQVKNGKVGVGVVRDLRGTVEREDAEIGVLITLQPPTAPMEKEAAAAGFYESEGWGQKYPRLQILTLEDLIADAVRVRMPPVRLTFKRAEPIETNNATQQDLL